MIIKVNSTYSTKILFKSFFPLFSQDVQFPITNHFLFISNNTFILYYLMFIYTILFIFYFNHSEIDNGYKIKIINRYL